MKTKQLDSAVPETSHSIPSLTDLEIQSHPLRLALKKNGIPFFVAARAAGFSYAYFCAVLGGRIKPGCAMERRLAALLQELEESTVNTSICQKRSENE